MNDQLLEAASILEIWEEFIYEHEEEFLEAFGPFDYAELIEISFNHEWCTFTLLTQDGSSLIDRLKLKTLIDWRNGLIR